MCVVGDGDNVDVDLGNGTFAQLIRTSQLLALHKARGILIIKGRPRVVMVLVQVDLGSRTVTSNLAQGVISVT